MKAAWSAAVKVSALKSSPCATPTQEVASARARSAPHINTTQDISFSPALHPLSVSRKSIELSMSPREKLWPGMPSLHKLGTGRAPLAADERAVLEIRLSSIQTQLDKQQDLQRQERQQQQEEQQHRT